MDVNEENEQKSDYLNWVVMVKKKNKLGGHGYRGPMFSHPRKFPCHQTTNKWGGLVCSRISKDEEVSEGQRLPHMDAED